MTKHTFIPMTGGIGNQLFQAAFASYLRDNHGFSAWLLNPGMDETPGPTTRACQINEILPDEFIIGGSIAKILHQMSLSRKWQMVSAKIGFLRSVRLEKSPEKTLGFLPIFPGTHQNRNILDYALPDIKARAGAALANRAAEIDLFLLERGEPPLAESIVIHVRRGDYLVTEWTQTLGKAYYSEAIRTLSVATSKTTKPIMVVSDDEASALILIQEIIPAARLLSLSDPVDVIAAIAAAGQKIIANSTLSLWGALFGSVCSKIAYPSTWFKGSGDWGPSLCQNRGWHGVPITQQPPVYVSGLNYTD